MYKMPKYVIVCKKLFTRNVLLRKDYPLTKINNQMLSFLSHII